VLLVGLPKASVRVRMNWKGERNSEDHDVENMYGQTPITFREITESNHFSSSLENP
jgi:hypothetical protein